jgi:hypothetical protein
MESRGTSCGFVLSGKMDYRCTTIETSRYDLKQAQVARRVETCLLNLSF